MKKLAIAFAMALMLTTGVSAAFAAPTTTTQDPVGGINQTMTSTDVDNGYLNANDSGEGVTTNDGTTVDQVIKSDGMVKDDKTTGTHRTHGEYQNNTNSCASCHQTHTGASKNLLFKDGVYNTCTACHDGTLGFYNVFKPSTAGTFGGEVGIMDASGNLLGNASMHLATGTVAIKAAPGGDQNGTGSWAGEFNCASCHAPHGSYSGRLLHYNPNGMGQADKAAGGIGLKLANVYNFGALPDPTLANAPLRILVRGTAADFGLDLSDGLAATDKVVRPYDLKLGRTSDKNTYVVSTAPWLYGYAYASPNKNYWTRFFMEPTDLDGDGIVEDQFHITTEADGTKHYTFVVDVHDEDWNANIHFNFGKGYVYTTGTETMLDKVVTGDVARGYVVKMEEQFLQDFGGIDITTVNQKAYYTGKLSDKTTSSAGYGIAMSAYCAACHTDYMVHSGSADGTFTKAYRHSTDSDSYTCVRCHYAHGTDVNTMKDAQERTVSSLQTVDGWTEAEAKAYMMDKNPSSALKRYTNMAVCWACHTDSKAEQLKNNSFYQSSSTVPHGLNDGY